MMSFYDAALLNGAWHPQLRSKWYITTLAPELYVVTLSLIKQRLVSSGTVLFVIHGSYSSSFPESLQMEALMVMNLCQFSS
ncbi:hypothetical protein CEXT_543631 [Caerostris extrusa]|uniref:Uncharacterized protein n=1 Tax=Caerostris extrusa TaxID=172846 RepID=A0AAV4R0S6_CAEEX|nr:hypothetical protein CEXT_543631 [Caerostris extrusa]